MDQQQYLDQLGEALNMLSPEEITDIQSYYANSIRGEVMNGISEEKAIEHLGPADQVADRILRTRAQPLPEGVVAPGRGQKHRHVGLMIAGIVTVACIVVSGVGQAVTSTFSGRHASLGRESFAVAAASVQTLTLESTADAINFSQSPDDQIHVEWSNSKEESHTVTQDGTALVLSTQPGGNIDFDWSFGEQDTDISVQLPDGYEADSMKISSTSGDIYADSIAVKDSLSFTTTSGSVDVFSLNVPGTLSVASSSGDLYLYDSIFGNMELHSTSGGMQLSDCTVSGTADMESTSGDFEWNEGALTGIGHFHTTSGGIQLSHVTAKDDIYVGSTSGDLQLNLAGGDYTVQTATVSGDVDVPNTSGSHMISAETVSGDIQVSFDND